jgi:hypothetical protein
MVVSLSLPEINILCLTVQGRPGAKGRDTAVEMALDPEEIDFDSETMALKAEAALRSTSFLIIIFYPG